MYPRPPKTCLSIILIKNINMNATRPTKISVSVRDAGKRVKESKKIVNLEFQYDGNDDAKQRVEFRHSIMSGKRRLLFNKNEIFAQTNKVALLKESVSFKKEGRFDHTWYDDTHLLRLHVIEKGDGFLYGTSFLFCTSVFFSFYHHQM
jgi:hypothetical protein